MSNRREFITLLGGVAVAWPLAARAQQPTMPVIGVLFSGSPGPATESSLAAFRQSLRGSGYVEGRNVGIEVHWANGRYDLAPALAADLVQRQVAIIVTGANAAALAAKAATTVIPVVFYTGGDPVTDGLVTSLNRPGANLTGVSALNAEVTPKRLELLHELLPTATIIAALVNPANSTAETLTDALEGAANTLGLQLHILRASTERGIDDAYAAMAQLRASGLMIVSDPFFNSRSDQFAALTIRHAVPAIYQYREFAAAGGVMSYGGSLSDGFRQVGIYAGRILKGEKPANLPVQRSTKVELIINLETTKVLGLTVPLALLTRADEVIE
jgi:putative ABC transport system substrate-binding protein